MYVIRKLDIANKWMLIYPDGMSAFSDSWRGAMDIANEHINYTFTTILDATRQRINCE